MPSDRAAASIVVELFENISHVVPFAESQVGLQGHYLFWDWRQCKVFFSAVEEAVP